MKNHEELSFSYIFKLFHRIYFDIRMSMNHILSIRKITLCLDKTISFFLRDKYSTYRRIHNYLTSF